MEDSHIFLFSFLLALLSIASPLASAQLSQNFYNSTSPNVEDIVHAAVLQKLQQFPVAAPGTLRLFFHDCFVRGCDASVMLRSPNGDDEKDNPIDLSLAGDGFDTVIKAKAAVDGYPQWTNKVSCADILALATRDVIRLTGGPFYPVELGRKDGRISKRDGVELKLPHPTFNLDELNHMFDANNLSQTDMIALSGAHTIGFSHCSQFSSRIYNHSRDSRIDPTLNSSYAEQLQQACRDGNPDVAVPMDPRTPQMFDNSYYQNLQVGMGLFSSDQALYTDPRSRDTVNLFASNRSAFDEAFVSAMTKLGRVGVKVGDEGEIQRDCSTVN